MPATTARLSCRSLRNGSEWQCRMAVSPTATTKAVISSTVHSSRSHPRHCSPPGARTTVGLLVPTPAVPEESTSASHLYAALHTALHIIREFNAPKQRQGPCRSRGRSPTGRRPPCRPGCRTWGEEEGPLSQGGSTGQGKGRLGSTGPLYSHARAPRELERVGRPLYSTYSVHLYKRSPGPQGGSSDRP